MIKFGTISDTDPDKFLARVQWDADGIVSDWLPLVTPGTKDTKVEFPLDVGEQVVCMMDEMAEDGVIIGAVYSEEVTPAAKNKDKYQVKFGDGLIIYYDRANKKLDLKLSDTELVMTESGWTIKRSSESLKKIISDLIDKILALTVTTPNGPSGTPINAADFTAIKNRLPNLFEA